MKLFDGKKVARKILRDTAEEIKEKKAKLKLAVILVGDDEASKLYVRLKKEAAAKVMIDFEEIHFDSQAKESEIIAKIGQLNSDASVNGIIVQLPLPAIFNVDRIIEAIDPKKDVDGFHKENRRLLEKDKEKIMPVLPLAILTALKSATKNLSGKKILALVNSEIFGGALRFILQKKGADVQYIVRNTCVVFGAEKDLKSADILISVCGCPNMIKGEMIKDGAILIDAGITRYHDGKVVGDVDAQSVEGRAAFLTPTPGGIGPLTVALLLRNVFLAASFDLHT